MSENILSCKSSEGEKVAVHGAWIDETKKTVLVIGVIISIVVFALMYVNNRVSQINVSTAVEIAKLNTETEIRISNLEKRVEELKEDCKKARRDYDSARSSMSQLRRRLKSN